MKRIFTALLSLSFFSCTPSHEEDPVIPPPTELRSDAFALDVFRTGGKQRFVDGTIEAVGGLDNIKLIHSSDTRLVISLYDPAKLNVDRLRELGSLRVYDTKAGHAITFGSASTIIRMGINEKLRNAVRSKNR